jgi:lipoate-protein ligase A
MGTSSESIIVPSEKYVGLSWRLLDLGEVDGYVMTNLYEAVGMAVSRGESPNTLILNHPREPFVNIGYHQVMEKEIDTRYAKAQGFPLVRRSIGGGAILDGPWEQDYFVIVHRKSPECLASIPAFYEKYLRPIVYTLKNLGLSPQFRPPNDILVDGKKISANGAVSIEDANVLAGDILLDLPVDLMSKVIKVPSEKFKDKLAKSMREWLTSLASQNLSPTRDQVKELVVEGFQEELGVQFTESKPTPNEEQYVNQLLEERKSPEWVFLKDWSHKQLHSKVKTRSVKVRGGVTLCQADYKADKLIRIVLELAEDKIREVSISGDFFTQPYRAALGEVEKRLTGLKATKPELEDALTDAFKELGIQIYGAKPNDFAQAILKAKEKAT